MAVPARILSAENDLKLLMAEVTRAMEKAQEAVARIAARAAEGAAAETQAAAPSQERAAG